MSKKAYRANRSKLLEVRFRTPLFHVEFQETCIEPIFEIQHSVPIKRCDNECVQERHNHVGNKGFTRFSPGGRKSNAHNGRWGGRGTILLNWRNFKPFERYSGFCDTLVLYMSSASCN